jgi:signal transduction histidine kinase
MLEAKQQMLLAISHELRSPLTRTKVALEFMEDDQTRQSILEDVEEMERLIEDLLESERLNTRHSKLQRSSVNLAELVEKLLSTDFGDRRERIGFAAPASLEPEAIDATRIRLLVKNLIENALCHSQDDAGPVEVTITQTAADQTLRVRDHGAGMSPEQVNNATEPFYRADSSRCRDTGGFGLGLYLCRRIAEAHGGSLTITSEPGRGTEVIVELPRVGGAPAEALGAGAETAAV